MIIIIILLLKINIFRSCKHEFKNVYAKENIRTNLDKKFVYQQNLTTPYIQEKAYDNHCPHAQQQQHPLPPAVLPAHALRRLPDQHPGACRWTGRRQGDGRHQRRPHPQGQPGLQGRRQGQAPQGNPRRRRHAPLHSAARTAPRVSAGKRGPAEADAV